ncbi:hypothetical protein QTP70_017561 [Hemibagrus guttatus]|uniref:Teneurin N-terminal domain-containing protein n=1 Tax=Hemibagrus guttatus TaxID=175788 RepID=A0AAE0QLB6_9TELE|nr:hypothetical protein QTP70_017561 [Hemibagrus guttatus]
MKKQCICDNNKVFFNGSLTLAELGVCEPQQQSVYCSDLGLVQQGYSLSAGYDADSDPEGLMTPERAVQLWRGQGLKSHHSSGLSSPDQSALTLTDSENEQKTDDESGRTAEHGSRAVWEVGRESV